MYYDERLIFASNEQSKYRIPSVIATSDGGFLAFCNDRRGTLNDHANEADIVMAKKDTGCTEWSEVRSIAHEKAHSLYIGCAVYDEITKTAFCHLRCKYITTDEFGNEVEALKLDNEPTIKEGDHLLISRDEGKTWAIEPLNITPIKFKHIDGKEYDFVGFTHGGAHGIQLKSGRLLCPSRESAGEYTDWDDIPNHVYNNSVYSDDHGKTWKVGLPVQLGTAEGTLIECADGSILYNSRAYFRDGKRYIAKSYDGGETFTDFGVAEGLCEETRMGCNASFLRVPKEKLRDADLLPEGSDSIVIFVNPRSNERRRMTACVSFDNGKTFTESKVFWHGRCAYSSLDFNTKSQMFCLLYEKGTEQNKYEKGIAAVEFDLDWLLS